MNIFIIFSLNFTDLSISIYTWYYRYIVYLLSECTQFCGSVLRYAICQMKTVKW